MSNYDPQGKAEIYKRIREHPGRVAHDRWQSLHRIHKVLQANELEILQLIDSVQDDERAAIEIMRSGSNPGAKDAFFDELIRRSHNYLSALKMLVDHTRNLMRHYEGKTVFEEYVRRVKVMIEIGRGPFLQKLRDYLIHYQIPPFAVEMNFTRGAPMRFTVCLERDAALEYKDWPANAKRYLTGQPDKINFREEITGYAADLENIYLWLYDRFEELHSQEIQEVNKLVVELQGGRNTPGHPDYRPPDLT